MSNGSGFRLGIEEQVFGEEDLLSLPIPAFVSEVPHYQSVWQFCQDWLNGQEVFELQTSGSTGPPKLISARREQMIESAASTGRFLGYKQGDRSLLCLNAAFVGGIMVLVRGLEFGLEVAVQLPSADAVSGLPDNHTFDHVSLSPIQLRYALENGANQLSQFKTVLVGGADIEPALLKDVSQVQGPRIYQTFGMTETLSHFALRHLNAPQQEDWYTLLPGVRIDLSAESELVVDWPGVTEVSTHTHDLVEMVSPTQFIWKGRTDFTINSGGIKIQPETVESIVKEVLAEMTGQSRELVLIALPDARLGQKAVLLLEGAELTLSQQDVLLERLKAALPPYHSPKAIFFLKEFARTPTGKPSRRAIAKALQSQIGLDTAEAGG